MSTIGLKFYCTIAQLPVKVRIAFKILLITFQALHNWAPLYITEILMDQYDPILAELAE